MLLATLEKKTIITKKFLILVNKKIYVCSSNIFGLGTRACKFNHRGPLNSINTLFFYMFGKLFWVLVRPTAHKLLKEKENVKQKK